MFDLAILASTYRSEFNPGAFVRYLSSGVKISPNSTSFQAAIKAKLRRFAVAHPFERSDEFGVSNVFSIESTSWFGFSVREFLDNGWCFIARPVGGTYRIEQVGFPRSADRFNPQHGVYQARHLALVGQEHVESNYKAPAAASYRFVGGKWKVEQF